MSNRSMRVSPNFRQAAAPAGKVHITMRTSIPVEMVRITVLAGAAAYLFFLVLSVSAPGILTRLAGAAA